MNHNEKVAKLGNAIREYRGSYDSKTKKWIRPENKGALTRVKTWLSRIGRSQDQIPKDVERIDGFAHTDEFRQWIGAF